ncbi:MAG: Benzoate rane transport protein, partial [Frankiales bacterium]|nr:Benzoate rane transport protein [Frankiales bacterium]
RLVATAAGLALLGAFAGAAAGALRDERTRLPAVVTLLVAGSGVAAGPLGAAPLGLLAGALLLLVLPRERAS